MFERFTELARETIVSAQEEAHALNHGYIGTEHLLLGALRQQTGSAHAALASFDLGLDDARERVLGIVPRGDQVSSGQVPFSPRAKHCLELGLRESLRLGDNFVGTEHLLLGLLDEPDGLAFRVLVESKIDPDELRAALSAGSTEARAQLEARLSYLQARADACSRRGAVLDEIAAASDQPDRVRRVAGLLSISDEEAEGVLAMRLSELAPDAQARNRAEREDLRRRLDEFS